MLFFILLVFSQAIDKTHLQNAYFKGRSDRVSATGDLVDGGKNFALFGGNLKEKKLDDHPPISVTDIGETISKSLWLGKLKKKDNPDAPTYVYDLPSANLLLINFGVDGDIFNKLPLNSKFLENRIKENLDVDFFPADEVSIMTTLLTGNLPQIHGVTGSKWKENGKPVDAFSTPGRSSSKNSIFDLLKVQENESNLHIVGAATTKVLAQAMTTDAYGASYFDSPQSFTSTDHPDLSFTWQDLLQSMSGDNVWKQSADLIANLDLKSPAVELFLMEMEYLNRVSKSFEQHRDAKSFYSLATTTVGPLRDNDQVLAIFSHFLENLLTEYKTAYPNGNDQLVFVVTPSVEPHALLQSKLEKMGYPDRGLKHMNSMELSEVCGTAGAVCVGTPKGGHYYQTYQISIWVLFLALLATWSFSCNFAFQDFTQDATLYSTWVRQDDF